MPRAIGTAISRRLATLHELDTVYSAEDLYDLLEVSAVDSINERILNQTSKGTP